jgi:predicted transcriptional regulator
MGQNNTNSDINENSMNSGKDFDFISALLDNELTDAEREKILAQLENDNDLHNRHIFEGAVKTEINKRITRIETPQYVFQNIQTSINTYSEKISSLHSQRNRIGITSETSQYVNSQNASQNISKNRQRNYFYLFGSVGVALLLLFFSLNFFFAGNDIPDNVNLVELSRVTYEKVEDGEIKIQYATNNAKELEKFFNEKMDYKVFVPDVKDAVLIGGVYNEMNGKKAAHFIHKKGDTLIYTMQICKKHIMDENGTDGIMVAGDMKENLRNGKNWLHCPKKQGGNENVILWQKDDAISSSVSKMGPDQIHAVLTNYK